jgi:hypothetical protein
MLYTSVCGKHWKYTIVQVFQLTLICPVHKEKIQQDATRYQNFIIPYLYEAQHVSGDTPPIIRTLKLHWQSLDFQKWKIFGRVAGRLCQANCA